jgi:long-chain acyl-CoA synthetase
MAHIFEMVFEQTCFFWGMVLGFGHPRSLSDVVVRNCAGDLRELRPTLMVAVPSIWETIMKGITKRVQESSVITRTLFWSAFYLKCFLHKYGLPGSGILDSIVFKKVAQATGGRMRLCMSGAGPIAKTTMRFISMAICPMISGYGITETSA